MNAPHAAVLRPITESDLPAVAAFLHQHLNSRLSVDRWARALVPTWSVEVADRGYLLEDRGQVVGVYAAFPARRRLGTTVQQFRNLAAWCVLEEYRGQSLRLLRAMTRDRDVVLTDLSPSGSVVPLNERLGFSYLDTSGSVVVNARWRLRRRVRVETSPPAIAALLKGEDRQVYQDHAAALAARHVVLRSGDRVCYVVYRRVRRKRLPLFAGVLYVSDRALFGEIGWRFYVHLLLRRGIPFTVVERRIVGRVPRGSVMLRSPRPKMIRGSNEVLPDDLYSELACVPW